MIQNITHVVEATEVLCGALKVPKGKMKERDYWNVRKVHSHIRRWKADKLGFDVHDLPPEAVGFGQIRYASYGSHKAGHSVRGFNVEDALQQLSLDLEEVFARCLTKLNEPTLASDLTGQENSG